jgi:hypothetical protein
LLTTCTGRPLAGLWYPIGVAAVCVIIGVLFIPNRSRNVEFDS